MAAQSPRSKLIAKIHIAQGQLDLDDPTYRDLLVRVTGKSSCRDMNDGQLRAVLAEMGRLGFVDSNGSTYRPSGRADVRLVYVLWKSLGEKGKLTDPSKSALRSFCANQTGANGAAKDPDHLTPEKCRKVIEALKAWEAR